MWAGHPLLYKGGVVDHLVDDHYLRIKERYDDRACYYARGPGARVCVLMMVE